MNDKSYNYEINDAPQNKCCKCVCPEGHHLVFWSCPIFLNETICGECCQIDALRADAPKLFSSSLGREITREELNEFCKKCGKNYATENSELADKMEQGTLSGGEHVDEQEKKQ